MMKEMFLLIFTAFLAENVVFTGALGSDLLVKATDKPSDALILGGTVGVLTAVSCTVCSLIPVSGAFAVVICTAVIALLTFCASLLLSRFAAKFYEKIKTALLLASCDTAAAGTVLLNSGSGRGIGDSILFGIAAGLGFLAAALIFAGVKFRLRFSDPPRFAKGLPVTLITLGLIALAFSGFAGLTF